MIHCTIDNQTAYPSTGDKIKVTLENQFVKDSGTYTYEISFPMDILQNQLVFGHVNRLEVSKMIADFEDCKLYSDNRLIMSGKGTVTSITDKIVKLQLVGGKSRVKYNSRFEQHFIDEIDYPPVEITHGIDTEGYQQIGLSAVSTLEQTAFLMIDLTKFNYVGQPGVAAFNVINDETSGVLSNNVVCFKPDVLKVGGVRWPTDKVRAYMTNMAVQPFLMYVLRKVIEFEGYTIARNDFDVDPWNRLLIANAKRTFLIKKTLPHWTVYTFLEEVRKLFNASFIFDDITRTVSIISTNELTRNDTVSYECADEFTSEYDEDGLQNLATSNIEYQFGSSENRDWKECLTRTILNSYPVKEYETLYAAITAAEAMTTRERRSTIFKVGNAYHVWAMVPKNGFPDADGEVEQRVQCGFFNHLVRDKDSEDSVTLKMSPVATYIRKRWQDGQKLFMRFTDLFPNNYILVPSMSSDMQTSVEDMTQDDDGEFYLSVQDAMMGGTDETATEDDTQVIQLMFQSEQVFNIVERKTTSYWGRTSTTEDTTKRLPITFTDYRMFPFWSFGQDQASLSLEAIPQAISYYGNGNVSLGAYFKDVKVDKNNLVNIKFITEDIPDPTRVYVFRNRKYIAQKIELEVFDNGIEQLKNGYFYEFI